MSSLRCDTPFSMYGVIQLHIDTQESLEGSPRVGGEEEGTWGQSGRQGLHRSLELCDLLYKAKGPTKQPHGRGRVHPWGSQDLPAWLLKTLEKSLSRLYRFPSVCWRSGYFLKVLILRGYYIFTAWKSNQQDHKHQFPSFWTSGSQHVEKGSHWPGPAGAQSILPHFVVIRDTFITDGWPTNTNMMSGSQEGLTRWVTRSNFAKRHLLWKHNICFSNWQKKTPNLIILIFYPK